jgi:hypothetical protein
MAAVKSAVPRTMHMSASSGRRSRVKWLERTGAQGVDVFARTQQLDLHDQRPINHHGPARRHVKIARVQSRFFLQLAP